MIFSEAYPILFDLACVQYLSCVRILEVEKLKIAVSQHAPVGSQVFVENGLVTRMAEGWRLHGVKVDVEKFYFTENSVKLPLFVLKNKSDTEIRMLLEKKRKEITLEDQIALIFAPIGTTIGVGKSGIYYRKEKEGWLCRYSETVGRGTSDPKAEMLPPLHFVDRSTLQLPVWGL